MDINMVNQIRMTRMTQLNTGMNSQTPFQTSKTGTINRQVHNQIQTRFQTSKTGTINRSIHQAHNLSLHQCLAHQSYTSVK
jgi:hypothetical protein